MRLLLASWRSSTNSLLLDDRYRYYTNVRRNDEVIACNVYLVITLTDMIPAVPFPSLEEYMT